MLNRRLIILVIAFTVGFVVLTARLVKLQIVDAEDWREVIRAFVHRTRPIETARGSILDRNGQVLAQDLPADELAIDYRAMNLDDKWLAKTALDRLVNTPEWSTLDRPARRRRIDETKAQIADQIANIPEAIAQVCHIPVDDVLERFQEIRARIRALREDLWSQKFDREGAQNRANAIASGADVDDTALNTSFQGTQLREELVAHTVRSNIPPEVATYFRQHSDDFPGLLVRDNQNRRDYPFGEAAAHITGTLFSVPGDALRANKFGFADLLSLPAGTTEVPLEAVGGNLGGYLPGDKTGESGAERLLETYLRGTRGERLDDLTLTGDEPDEEKKALRILAKPGINVQLTVDAQLQKDIYDAIRAPEKRKGRDYSDRPVAIVVLALNGEILAQVSYPSYDPNTIDDHRLQLLKDKYRLPTTDRTIRAIYQPGSTVKPLMAIAALSEHLITPDFSVNCTGRFYPGRADIFQCDGIHNNISLVEAIAKSCNVYFYTVGQKMGLERLERWYDFFGCGHETGMEFADYAGSIPTPAMGTDANTANHLSMMASIGQGKIAVTPLQMANAYAILLRGGQILPPHIIKDNPNIHPSQAVQLSPAMLASVRQGMEECTTIGTAKSEFKNFRLRVAGKTGTAQTPYRIVIDENGNAVDDPTKPLLNVNGTPQLKADGTPAYKPLAKEDVDAWFIGYAPADNPKFVVCALMEWGGHGGTEAAPLAKEAFLQLERHNYLPRLDVP